MKRSFVARGAINLPFLLALLVVLGVLVVGAGGAWYFQKKFRARGALTDARAAVEQTRWTEAIDGYRTFLRQSPNDLPALREYSKTLRQARPQELEHVLSTITADRRILRLDPSDREAFRRLLKLYAATDNNSDLAFMAAQTQQLQLAPEDIVEAALYAARADAGQSRWKDAAHKVEDVIRRTQDQRPPSRAYIDALVLKARIAERSEARNDQSASREPLEMAMEADPQAVDAALYLARLDRKAAESATDSLTARAKLDQARARLVNLKPTRAIEQVRLAAELIELGDRIAAAEWLARAEQAPDSVGADEFLLTADRVLLTFMLKSQLAMLEGRLPEGGVAFADAALAQLKERRYQLLAQPDAIRVHLLAHQLAQDAGDKTAAKQHLTRADTLFNEYLENAKIENQPPPAETQALLAGLLAHRHNDYYRAVALLEPQAKPDSPASAEIWGLLADTYGRLGQVRRAASAADKYINLRGRASRELQLQQLNWYIQANDWLRAKEIADGWTDLEDGDIERQAVKQRIALRVALNADAERQAALLKSMGSELERLLTRNPNAVALLQVRADWYAAQNRTREAEATWQHAVEKGDDPNRARLGLAEFYTSGEQLDAAVSTLREYLQEKPESPEVWLRLGDLQLAVRQYDDAQVSYDRGREIARAQDQQGLLRAFAIKPAELELARDNVAAANQQLEALAAQPGYERDANLRRFWLRALKNRGDDVLRTHTALAQRLVDELRGIEGDAGVEWRLWQADLLLLNKPSAADRARAIAFLQAAREADPDWEAAILLLGKAYELNKDWRAAEALYLAAAQRHPENRKLGRQLAQFYRQRGREGELRRLLKSEAFPEGIRVAQEVVEAIEQGEYAAARERLQKHIQANPKDTDARLFQVQLEYRLEPDLARALQQLEELSRESNDADTVFRARVNLLVAANQPDQALQLLDQRVTSPGDEFAYSLRAGTRQLLGDLTGAEADWKKLAELTGNDPRGAEHLAVFYVETQRPDEAIAVLQDGLTRNAGSTALKRTLAKSLLVRNRSEDRKAALDLLDELEALQTRAVDPELLKLKALANLDNDGSREEARRWLEEAVTANPLMEDAHLTLIQLAITDNNLPEAQRLLQRAFEPHGDRDSQAGTNRNTPPDRPVPLARPRLIAVRAQLEAARGDIDSARRSYVEALELDPTHLDALRGLATLVSAAKDPRAFEQLEARLKTALEQSPLDSGLHVLQAQALSARGRQVEARQMLEAFAAAHAQAAGPGIMLSLADFANAANDAAATKAWIDRACELAPRNDAVLRARIVWLGRERAYEPLLELVQTALREKYLRPAHAPFAATILFQSQQPEHRAAAERIALETARRIASDDPAQLDLIAFLFAAGKFDEALAIGDAYLAKKPADAAALNSQAWILGMAKNDYARALELADRGIAAAPRSHALLDTRGQLLMKVNKPAAALSDFRLAAEVAKEPQAQAQALLNCARAATLAQEASAFEIAVRDLHKLDPLDKLLTTAELEELQKLQAPPPQ